MPASITEGDLAPAFTLKNQDKQRVSLADFRGRNVVLVFHPFAFSALCDVELCQLRDEFEDFAKLDAEVLVVSCDSLNSQKHWKDEQGFPFTYLSDFWPHGEATKAYGVFNERFGCANRATFIIDGEGKVVLADVQTEMPGHPRDVALYKKALENLPA